MKNMDIRDREPVASWATSGQHDVALYVDHDDDGNIAKYTIKYGKHVMESHCCGAAAIELGQCIMHAIDCAGHLDPPELKQ